MRDKTKRQKVLELLQTGEPIRENRLWAIGCNSGYHVSLTELRAEGYEIECRITLDGTYYQLKEGKNDGRNTDITSGLQAAHSGETWGAAAASL